MHKTIPEWMKTGCDLMVDIETLSTEPNAVILSIGAVKFNPHVLNTEEELNAEKFYINIDRDDSAKYNLHVCEQTIAWWAGQSTSAQAALLKDQKPLREAIETFTAWIGEVPRVAKCWAKDPDFDVVILRKSYAAIKNGTFPVPYFLSRSVRTITDLAYPNEHDAPNIRVGTHHNAVDDCISQALMVQHCYHRIGLSINNYRPIL